MSISALTLPLCILIPLRCLLKQVIIQFDDPVAKGKAFRLDCIGNLTHALDVRCKKEDVNGAKLLTLLIVLQK